VGDVKQSHKIEVEAKILVFGIETLTSLVWS